MTVMTFYSPERINVNGNTLVAFGPGFADVNAPKLTEVPVTFTCAFDDPPMSTTDTKMKSQQRLCDKDASERPESRTVKLDRFEFFVDDAEDELAQVEAMFTQDKLVSKFVRPFADSDTPLIVGDKGIAENFRVASFEFVAKAGDQWKVSVEAYEVRRADSPRVALV